MMKSILITIIAMLVSFQTVAEENYVDTAGSNFMTFFQPFCS